MVQSIAIQLSSLKPLVASMSMSPLQGCFDGGPSGSGRKRLSLSLMISFSAVGPQQKIDAIQLHSAFFLYNSCMLDFHIQWFVFQNFSILVIFVTFTFHLYIRTVICKSHTKIFDIYQFHTKLEKQPFLFFAMVRHFLVDVSEVMVIITESMCGIS